MVKQLLPAIAVIIFLSSCSTFKPLNFTSSKQVISASATPVPAKFIEEIIITPQTSIDKTEVKSGPQATVITRGLAIEENLKEQEKQIADIFANRSASDVENASSVQLKYAVLLNTGIEHLPARSLLESVDEWYGVRYRTGGNTKSGVDCSGFSVAVYAAVYGITLPRVSREQYRTSRKISTTELQEGDLVFFDTRGSGSVTHVGVYLGNNKFIHASVSRGVMVSGLFEPYYLKRFVGAGRIDNKPMAKLAP